MAQDPFHYVGTELDVFSEAHNWRAYWTGMVRPLLGRTVLEVGAGIGSATRSLWTPAVAHWLALEPDDALSDRLRRTVAEMNAPTIEVRSATVAELPAEETFDTALYIDVLEHIDGDLEEVARVAQHIRPGGHIVVLAPAHQWLFTPFDKALGHFRRYDRRSLGRLTPDGFSMLALRYLDSVGMLASLGNRLVLRSAAPTPAQIALWDGRMVPLSRRLDGLLRFRCGKSILGVWQKLEETGTRSGRTTRAVPGA
ncbi:class I SAM-dependent methyltransferase [Neoroseomonas soli]|uniref:Class I SAM-dependent methyltransferase n=1 Tax=Neoroseomonas soli TaxID=1081025 RepID=A0A9X9X4G1_9PROT|nr:class I SAM-dependent methyltransferase [Neoroseomonas soli]MBR0674290.1 class I SAM-dependent methyltransferase [Neoroseomonas soli]